MNEHLYSSIGLAIIPFLFIFFAFYCIASTLLIVSYTCEIQQFKYRAHAVSMCQITMQLASPLDVFVNPIAPDAIWWKFYVVYRVGLVFITLNVWFSYPETKGYSLRRCH